MTELPDLPPDLLTLAAAARRLGIHPKTALRMAGDSTFPGGAAKKVGGQWRVSVPLLDLFLHTPSVPKENAQKTAESGLR